jgi:hypothetical protein
MAKKESIVSVDVDGIKASLDTSVFNDLEIYEMIYDSSSNAINMIPVYRKVFGKDYERVKNALRDENGIVTAQAMDSFMTKAIEAAGSKNS